MLSRLLAYVTITGSDLGIGGTLGGNAMKHVRDIFLGMLDPAAKKWWKEQLQPKAVKKPPASARAGKTSAKKQVGK